MGGQKVGTHHWYGPWVLKIHQNLRCSLGLQRQRSRFRHRWWEVRFQPPHHSGDSWWLWDSKASSWLYHSDYFSRFPRMGPLKSSIYGWIFHYKPPSYWGSSMTMETPKNDHDSDGFSWTSMDVNGFGISSHILGCLVGRFLFSDVLLEDLRGIATSLELFWWIWVGRVDIA